MIIHYRGQEFHLDKKEIEIAKKHVDMFIKSEDELGQRIKSPTYSYTLLVIMYLKAIRCIDTTDLDELTDILKVIENRREIKKKLGNKES